MDRVLPRLPAFMSGPHMAGPGLLQVACRVLTTSPAQTGRHLLTPEAPEHPWPDTLQAGAQPPCRMRGGAGPGLSDCHRNLAFLRLLRVGGCWSRSRTSPRPTHIPSHQGVPAWPGLPKYFPSSLLSTVP